METSLRIDEGTKTQKATSKAVKLDESIRMARACEDDQTNRIAEDVAVSRSKDELFADALNNQNQIIGTLAEQLAKFNLSAGRQPQPVTSSIQVMARENGDRCPVLQPCSYIRMR